MAGIFLKRYRYMLAVMVGVIAGTLIANYAIINITDKVGVLNNDFRLSIIDMKVNNVALWQYIFKTRIKEFALLILLLITPVAVPAVYIIFGIIGMSVGMVVSVSVMNMGIKGMFVYIVMTFPHYIIYAITICILISIWETIRGSYVNINIRKIAMALLVSFILLLAGTLCEAYVNPGCLKMLLEHISYCV